MADNKKGKAWIQDDPIYKFWAKYFPGALKGLKEIIPDKLYYNPKEQQFYDFNNRRLTYRQVADMGVDPMNPRKPELLPSETSAWLTPRTGQIGQTGQPIYSPPPKPEPDEIDKIVAKAKKIADLTGRDYNEVLTELLGLSPPAEGDSWQRGLAEREFEWQQKAVQEETRQKQYENWSYRLAGTLRGEQPPDNTALAQAWEAGRQEILNQWKQDPYRNWIKIQTEQMNPTPNPYSQQPMTLDEEIAFSEQEVERLETAYKATEKMRKLAEHDSSIALPEEAVRDAKQISQALSTAELRLTHLLTSPEYIEGRRLAELPASETEGRNYEPAAARPTTPATPNWLSKIYPTMDERIPERGAIGQQFSATPLSGQWASRMAPSELAGWAGYAEYAGGNPEDLLWQTQQQLPQPRTGTGWRPARQRVTV